MTCAGAELLFLDPHALHLPDQEESVNANLFDATSQHFFRAQEAWPGAVAPFVAVTRACVDVMAPLELPDAPPESGADDGKRLDDGSPPAPVLTPDNREQPVSGERIMAERQDSAASAAAELRKRKRDSLSDDDSASDSDCAAAMSEDGAGAGAGEAVTPEPRNVLCCTTCVRLWRCHLHRWMWR